MVRLVLYCHNVAGLGHIIRTMQIGVAAQHLGGCKCLIITGCRHLRDLNIDDSLCIEELPPVRSGSKGFIAIDPELADIDIMRFRGEQILAICRREQPHVFLADYNPFGLDNELLPTLIAAVEEAWTTRFVWGIPYFAPNICKKKPPRIKAVAHAIALYSSAIAYVDPKEIDVFSQFEPWILPTKTDYMGFVSEPPVPVTGITPGLVAITCGGGSFALNVCQLVLLARVRLNDHPDSIHLRFLIGPMADAESVATILEGEKNVEVLRTGHTCEAIHNAAAVISCAGYNNAMFLLRTELPIIFLPMSDDQRDRTEPMNSLSGVWVLDLSADNSLDLMTSALREALATGFVQRKLDWNFNGAKTAANWLLSEARASILDCEEMLEKNKNSR